MLYSNNMNSSETYIAFYVERKPAGIQTIFSQARSSVHVNGTLRAISMPSCGRARR
jgi:hypothetical protein